MSRTRPDPARLAVRAYPRAGTDRVGPMVDGALEVRVARPAADGEANGAIRRLLAAALDVAPSRLSLISGERSRHKRYRVEGMTAAELAERLGRLPAAD